MEIFNKQQSLHPTPMLILFASALKHFRAQMQVPSGRAISDSSSYYFFGGGRWAQTSLSLCRAAWEETHDQGVLFFGDGEGGLDYFFFGLRRYIVLLKPISVFSKVKASPRGSRGEVGVGVEVVWNLAHECVFDLKHVILACVACGRMP